MAVQGHPKKQQNKHPNVLWQTPTNQFPRRCSFGPSDSYNEISCFRWSFGRVLRIEGTLEHLLSIPPKERKKQLPRKVRCVWKTSARKPLEFSISPLGCRVCAPRHLSLHWSWQGSCTKILQKQVALQSFEILRSYCHTYLVSGCFTKLVLTYLSSQ